MQLFVGVLFATNHFAKRMVNEDILMFLPCGLVVGFSITVVGTPHYLNGDELLLRSYW